MIMWILLQQDLSFVEEQVICQILSYWWGVHIKIAIRNPAYFNEIIRSLGMVQEYDFVCGFFQLMDGYFSDAKYINVKKKKRHILKLNLV